MTDETNIIEKPTAYACPECGDECTVQGEVEAGFVPACPPWNDCSRAGQPMERAS